jgi:hypothetical protein
MQGVDTKFNLLKHESSAASQPHSPERTELQDVILISGGWMMELTPYRTYNPNFRETESEASTPIILPQHNINHTAHSPLKNEGRKRKREDGELAPATFESRFGSENNAFTFSSDVFLFLDAAEWAPGQVDNDHLCPANLCSLLVSKRLKQTEVHSDYSTSQEHDEEECTEEDTVDAMSAGSKNSSTAGSSRSDSQQSNDSQSSPLKSIRSNGRVAINKLIIEETKSVVV